MGLKLLQNYFETRLNYSNKDNEFERKYLTKKKLRSELNLIKNLS